MSRLQLVVMGVAFIACCYATPPSGPQSFPKFRRGAKDDFKNNILKAEEAARISARGKNFIDRADFKVASNNMYNERTKPEIRVMPTDAEIEAQFKLYDRDHNDKIDMKEGMMGLMQHQELFYYDQNMDGRLDEDELMNMYDTPNEKNEYSESADFVELYQRMQSHARLPRGWENNIGKVFQ